jgi:hypothetical protein
MVRSRKKGKTMHGEGREIINHMNHQCIQEAVEKSLILPICHADKRTANYCVVSVVTVKQIRQEGKQRNYAVLKPCLFDKVHVFPPQCSLTLPSSKIYSWVTDSRAAIQHLCCVTLLSFLELFVVMPSHSVIVNNSTQPVWISCVCGENKGPHTHSVKMRKWTVCDIIIVAKNE